MSKDKDDDKVWVAHEADGQYKDPLHIGMKLTADQIASLYAFLAHGDTLHKDWLLDAIIAWNKDLRKPSIYGSEKDDD